MKINKFGVIGLISFLIFFAGAIGYAPAAEMDQSGVHQVTLKIDGIGCGACVGDIQTALVKTPGVLTAEMKVAKKWFFWSDLSDVRAVVDVDPGKTTPDDLIKAVAGASNSMYTYKATHIE